MGVILEALERYLSLVIPIKISYFLVMYILIGIEIMIDCSGKQIPREHDITNTTIYLLTQSLIFLTMELADMPTKFQHSLQRSNSHINIITN